MKTTIMTVALLMSLSSVNAQEAKPNENPNKEHHPQRPKKTPEERAQLEVTRLNDIAGLSEDQKAKIKTQALTKFTKVDAIREKYKGQKEKHEVAKQEMDVVRKEYRQSIKTILTPEQLEKVKQKGKEIKQKRKESHEHKEHQKPQGEIKPDNGPDEDVIIDPPNHD